MAQSFMRALAVFKQSIPVLSAVANSSGMLKDLAHLQTNKKRRERTKSEDYVCHFKRKAKISAGDFSEDNIVSYTIYLSYKLSNEVTPQFKGIRTMCRVLYDVVAFERRNTNQ